MGFKTISIYLLVSTFFGLLAICDGTTQKFRVVPEDLEISEGHNALLRCEVENRVGAVQWTKDGFAFGFSSKIPGFPRYSVLIDKENSIYNLQIKNVSLEDDAEYQCQVGPAAGNPAIRASAKLITVAAPTAVNIETFQNQAKIEVIENQNLTITCTAENAYPAAELIWYLENAILTNASSKVMRSKKVPKRFRTISILNLQPTSINDEKEIMCIVKHKMIDKESQLNATVKLSVLYPPKKPQIEGFSLKPYHDGQNVQLACVNNAANPPAQVTWVKNDAAVNSPKRISGKTTENIYKFTAQPEDNDAVLVCEAKNKLTDVPLRSQINLKVLFPPKDVIIEGPSIANVGENVHLSCTSAVSNPAANLTWSKNGEQLIKTRQIIQKAKYGWISISNITLLIDPQYKTISIACNALNEQLGESYKKTHVINILYPPSPPLLTGYNNGDIITSGSVLKLQCVSNGGNPTPKMYWYKNDKRLNVPVKTTDLKVLSELSILINSSDNNAIYKCEIQSEAIEFPIFAAKTLSVYFPPDNVKITISPKNLTPGVRAKLTCDSSSSNPPAKLSWWKDGISVSSANPTTNPGLWGGAVSSLDTYINITKDLNNIVYTCQSNNEELQRSVHEAISLNILYPPKIEIKSTTFIGIEGEQIVIDLVADGNPKNFIYTWTRNGIPIGTKTHSKQRIITKDSKLIINSLNKNDAGSYYCEISNTQGSDLVEIKLLVQYSPEIEETTDFTSYREGDDAILSCKINAYPLTENNVKWSRTGFDIFQRSVSSFVNNTALLCIKNVTKEDMGFFTCHVDNQIGSPSEKNIFLIIETSPVIDAPKSKIRFAAKTGEKANISCLFKAYPDPTIIWRRKGKEVANEDFINKFSTAEEKIFPLNYRTTLIINSVTKEDYGQYECLASNIHGIATNILELSSPTKPDIPLNLKAINISDTFIIVEWIPGFNGGSEANYRLRYKMLNEGDYTSIDTKQGVLNFTLINLKPGQKYKVSIMAFNEIGNSKYSDDIEVKLASNSTESDENYEMPNMMIIAITSAAMILLVLNAALVAWFVIRRQNQNNKESDTINDEAYSKDDNRSVYKLPITALQADARTNASSTYLVENVDIIQSTSYPPKYQETAMFSPSYVCNQEFTRTLPHTRRVTNGNILMSSHISKDDQIILPNGVYIPSPSPASSLIIKGGSYVSSPSPAPPPDGSYFNMSDKYITYPSHAY